ncbi:IS256 family transposase [Psychrobacter sanguinis]|uniref:IS256 family transposase n=1 Tax=Psychrobacter sanguinis TaxID=861445 RepID=UPI0028AD5427|nr:IS256 family transposase [Psychrobacter sanguinis]
MTKETELKKLAEQMAKHVGSFEDIKAFQKQLMQSFIDTALEAEMEEHLGYPKHEKADKPNKRNGHTKKTVRSDTGDLEISTPRDREGSFDPVLVGKHQTRITGLDDKIISFYAKGQTTTEIVESIKDIYDVNISTSLVSRVTDNIIDDITAWQNRPLSSLYPIVYLDCIVVKIRQDKQIINKAIYLALGVNLEGKKELLGMWLSENEGAKFWLGILTELQNRGVQDILIACVDGLKGFSEAINTVYPNTQVQLCIVHMVRYSMKFVPWKDRRKVAADLKAVYGADTLELAEANLEQFDDTWGNKYPHVVTSWRNNWEGLTVFFGYPKDIRKAIYTTNAIESLNSVIRTAVNKRKIFPSDQAAFKVVYLATQQASKKWSMPIRNWTSALNRFMIMFDERVSKHLT